MSCEKNDWFAALYVTGIKCNGFTQMKVCDTLWNWYQVQWFLNNESLWHSIKLILSIMISHSWKFVIYYETGIKYNDFAQMEVVTLYEAGIRYNDFEKWKWVKVWRAGWVYSGLL